ncbi:ADP-ribosylglycohydrolase family protein [Nitrospina sp. 32_T5]|uniref:ADP-ribosylglycohydrolase family protein n=1 Tax=unclassified Nitrospina TaxID=2638683 RepID=UPI003F9BF5CD
MLGAIAGDIIGSRFEHAPIQTVDFELFTDTSRFTDDTVLTVAVADSIFNGTGYGDTLKNYFRRYPDAGYGRGFLKWGQSDASQPYNSWGNGSAMRVSPVGFAFDSIESVLLEAEKSASVTHNHPEGIKGAQATALAVFLARSGSGKDTLAGEIESRFGYDLHTPLDIRRRDHSFDVSCQGTVPPALRAFLESTDFEDAVRKAVSLGGDSDTLACITGSVAHAFYRHIPDAILDTVLDRLESPLRRVTTLFCNRYSCL